MKRIRCCFLSLFSPVGRPARHAEFVVTVKKLQKICKWGLKRFFSTHSFHSLQLICMFIRSFVVSKWLHIARRWFIIKPKAENGFYIEQCFEGLSLHEKSGQYLIHGQLCSRTIFKALFIEWGGGRKRWRRRRRRRNYLPYKCRARRKRTREIFSRRTFCATPFEH